MASCSQKANLLGKRKPEDGFGTELVLKKHKEKFEEKETEARVELLSDEANSVTVETEPILKGIREEKETAIGFSDEIKGRVELLENEANLISVEGLDEGPEEAAALEKKKNEYLHKRKIFLDVAHKGALCLPPKYCIDHKVWYQEDYLQQESLRIQENPNINFLEDVGDVVSVRLIVNHEGKHVGYGFVEFASANQAKKIKHVRLGFVEFASANEAEKALEKNGEYLYDRDIFLDFVEEATYTILSSINIFKRVGEVVRVRLIVDHRGESLGCGFVEFASAEEAKKAVQEKSGCAIYVKVAEKAPYLFRPKCNLADLAEKLWYEDKLRREGFGLPSKSELRKEEAVFCGKKITFSDKD
ncbi:hypothetical protein IGI04_006212 [Brassica rapa subsp. trilocularis]|uniref:RRM domain-containing protein n=1 Tax=Brassica rapa subsp. trilocularis TaxID=1813537 RepID=A0ABQ7NG69_BRACM|nr:hypothetical protein IGI04_006212 [Brassica rapa subsp. trilocularis]